MESIIKNESALTLSTLKGYSENFIGYLDVDDLTLKAYKVGIENFMSYLKEHNINMPTRDNVIEYRNHLRATYQDNTINSYMTALRRLFKYLKVKGVYEDLTIDIKGARHSNTPKKQVLTLEQIQNIYKSLTNPREKCLFGLMCSTGVRVCEVARANIEDIKTHNGETVLFLLRKMHDSKDEYVKLDNQVMQDILDYVDGRTTGAIFVSESNHNKGNGVSVKTLRREINKIFERFGIKEDTMSCHSLRRTFACISYESGSSIYDIKQVLAHKSIQTTTRYLQQVDRDKNKTEYNVASLIFN